MENETGLAFEMLAELKAGKRRLFIGLMATIALLFITNMAWLYVFQSYDYVNEEYTQSGDGYNNINTGTQGDVFNGTDLQTEGSNEEE